MIKQEAKQLIEAGYKIIPLLQNEKHNLDKEILTKEYSIDHFDILTKNFNKPHTNLGINLGASLNGLIDIDIDSEEAIKLASKFFPTNTGVIGRRNKDKVEITHYLYQRENHEV